MTSSRTRIARWATVGLAVGSVASLSAFSIASSAVGEPDAPVQPDAGKVLIDATGQFSYPSGYTRKIAELGASAESCLSRHGAKPVPTGEGGSYYPDPSGTASAACKTEISAASTYSVGAEAQAIRKRENTLLVAVENCLGTSDLSRSGLASARAAGRDMAHCVAMANAKP